MSDDGGMYAHSDEVRSLPSFYLTTFILLPEGSNTLDVKFYGDDGTSSLSASPAGKVEESRQALGVLIERSSRREDASVDYLGGSQVSEELLICPYDELAFKEFRIPPGTGQVNISDDIPDNDYISRISVEDGDDFPCNIAAFKRRTIRVYPSVSFDGSASNLNQAPRFALSGSRGVGGVFSDTVSAIDVFDLEEDEEEEDGSFDLKSGMVSSD